MEVQLTIEQPDGAIARHSFTEEPITVGSAVANHVVLDDSELAPHQLIIFREKGEWVIRSLADGPDIVCDERPLARHETRLLGHEAMVTMGSYTLGWCAEAVPLGAPKDLARPVATRTGSGQEVGAETDWSAGSGFAATAERGALEPATSPGTMGDSNGHDHVEMAHEGDPARDALFPEHEMPLDPDAMHTESLMKAALDVTFPDDLQHEPSSDGSFPEGSWTAQDGNETADPQVQASTVEAADTPVARRARGRDRHQVSLPEGSDLESQALLGRGRSRVTVHGYRRMRPFRAYPLVVQVTRTPVGEPGEPGPDGDFDFPELSDETPTFVRIVPSLPGCVVTPVSARLDLQRGAEGVRFWVTPVAAGRHRDGWVDVTWEGSPPARMEMPCHVVSSAGAGLFLLLALATAGLANLPAWVGWNLARYLSQDYLGSLAAPAKEAIRACGGVTHILVGLAAFWLVLAFLAWAARRPRQVTFAATQADT